MMRQLIRCSPSVGGGRAPAAGRIVYYYGRLVTSQHVGGTRIGLGEQGAPGGSCVHILLSHSAARMQCKKDRNIGKNRNLDSTWATHGNHTQTCLWHRRTCHMTVQAQAHTPQGTPAHARTLPLADAKQSNGQRYANPNCPHRPASTMSLDCDGMCILPGHCLTILFDGMPYAYTQCRCAPGRCCRAAGRQRSCRPRCPPRARAPRPAAPPAPATQNIVIQMARYTKNRINSDFLLGSCVPAARPAPATNKTVNPPDFLCNSCVPAARRPYPQCSMINGAAP